MKTKFYFLLLLLLPILSIQAVTTTFYVNPASTAANDENEGTNPAAPWVSLNPTKWVEGCVVMLSPGVHPVLQTAFVTKNVTLQGTSKAEVIIEGLSEDDIARGSESPRFFQVTESVTLTLKDISLRNFITTVDMWGGMFNVSSASTLTLQNVDIANAKLPLRGGAAIYSAGTLNITNVSFENCISAIGAAICIQELAVATINNATFKNNNTDDGVPAYKFGGAIHVNSTTANITINNCFFESNRCANDISNPNFNYPVGGAIAFRVGSGYTSKLHVTNSTFYRNSAAWSGGAIMIDKMGSFGVASNLDLFFANNTFVENSVNNMHGHSFSIGGGSDTNMQGSISFVNNTFMHNGPAVPTGGYSTMFFNSHKLSFNYINNLMRDQNWNADQQKYHGWGFVLNNGEGNLINPTFKGNVWDAVGGDLGALVYDQMYSTENSFGSKTADSLLTRPVTGVPYLAITSETSIAINRGINEFSFNSKNIVPTTDVRGNAIYGSSKDAGAFEYNPDITSIKNPFSNEVQSFAYLNPSTQVINLVKEVSSVVIFDLAGTKMMSDSNASIIDVNILKKGLYIVFVVNHDGTVLIQKVQKF